MTMGLKDPEDPNDPLQLLFVGRRNLQQVVSLINPDLVLVPRNVLAAIASDLLSVIEGVVEGQPKETSTALSPRETHWNNPTR